MAANQTGFSFDPSSINTSSCWHLTLNVFVSRLLIYFVIICYMYCTMCCDERSWRFYYKFLMIYSCFFRRESRKAVILQHGVLDSSLRWAAFRLVFFVKDSSFSESSLFSSWRYACTAAKNLKLKSFLLCTHCVLSFHSWVSNGVVGSQAFAAFDQGSEQGYECVAKLLYIFWNRAQLFDFWEQNCDINLIVCNVHLLQNFTM